ncbi:MAG: K(+)-transporting ATPase subunit F [Acidobacteriota bacterium]|nr:K(+)-transporting ATPase subunit F [Acidobacteriota bacterium]
MLRPLLGIHESLRANVGESVFIIAGAIALILFVYLLYALLHPERF